MLRHDKLVDDLEAARLESQQREDVQARGQDALPLAEHEAIAGAAIASRGQLLGTIRLILERGEVALSSLRLPALEARALAALQTAVSGRGERGEFVFAEDRRDLLERALAVLQPSLSRVDDLNAQALGAQIADLSAQVADLRGQLSSLADAQDEIMDGGHDAAKTTSAPGDKPPPPPSDPDAHRPASTLAGPGPEAPDAARPPTTLVGPELADAPAPPTTLVGPDLADAPAPPTTLVGPDLADAPAPPTTLVGPELPPEPERPTTLGEPAELAELASRPWWRRPFG